MRICILISATAITAISFPTSCVLPPCVQSGFNLAQPHNLEPKCNENSCDERKPCEMPQLGSQLQSLYLLFAGAVLQVCWYPASCLISLPCSWDFVALSENSPVATDHMVWLSKNLRLARVGKTSGTVCSKHSFNSTTKNRVSRPKSKLLLEISKEKTPQPLWEPVSVLHHPHSTEVLIGGQEEPFVFQLMSIASGLGTR